MSSVLFEEPGPKTRARHRTWAVLGSIVILAFLALVILKLWTEGAITPDKWSFLTMPSILLGLFEALLSTLFAAAIAIVLSVVFGLIFAAGRLSRVAVIRWPSILVIEFFRAVPLLLLIFFIFLVYSDVLGALGSLVISLMLYNGSVLAEVFRAGILAVPKGQAEAGYAIGMNRGQVLRLIQLPQAIRTMLPAIISQCVVALKDTALGFTIAYPGFVREGELIFTSTLYNNPIAVGIVLAAVFIAINYSLSRLAVYLEGRQRAKMAGQQGMDQTASTTEATDANTGA
ncbi:amino acid ABC transporter permease [Arthrobacter castelli]|uniref:amino acid ABC transporter permease n=1 Tax=Arthrobacter castelli TaxID=271431 RepID=UPI00047CC0B0|nr:amino acid ABC transporter permease [Arthrobacter castelli]